MGKLQGKTAVITGATAGIGLAVARLFATEGAFVFITGRRQKELDDAVKEIGDNACGVQGDVASLADLDRLYATVGATGRIDVVVANAGVAGFTPLEAVTEEYFDKIFSTNVKGALFTAQKALPLLNDGGSIILTGSVASAKGTPAFAVYGASKAAIRNFARGWTTELKDRRIRVNVLSPGPIATPLTAAQPQDAIDKINSTIPMGRMGEPDEVAKAALFLACDDSSFVTGIELFVDGGRAQVLFTANRRPAMLTHPFAVAAARRDAAAMAAVFADDVTYHTPTLTSDLHGKDLTLRYLKAGTGIVDDLTYTEEASDDQRAILFWTGILDQREFSGATVLASEPGGLIHDITVLQRPWGVAANFRDGILPRLADVVPPPAWQLDDPKAPVPDPDSGAGQRPGGTLPLAPNVAFHSAILTQTLHGQDNVRAYQNLVDDIQGPRAYLARIASPGRLVEYWNCVIDGHLQQGIDLFQLDDEGQVTDQTVWLRPWPVVALLRDRAIAASPPFIPADYWRLPAGPSRLP